MHPGRVLVQLRILVLADALGLGGKQLLLFELVGQLAGARFWSRAWPAAARRCGASCRGRARA